VFCAKKGVHCIIVKKTNIFDAGMVVFLNAINVYTKQKKCILQLVVQSLTLEFKFYISLAWKGEISMVLGVIDACS